jgi:hypothetical protein
MLVAALAIPAHSQETSGNLEGRILDESGGPIELATVTVTGPYLQGERTTITAPDGHFRFLALPVGKYRVDISHVSFEGTVLENIRVRLGGTTDVGEVHLAAQLYEVDVIEVTAEAPMIDPASTVLGSNLFSEEYGELPIDRNYRNMAVLLPHVNESYLGDEVGFAGGTGQENKYYIDGVDGTDVLFGMRSTELPYNFIRELQVRSGGYQAEYSSSLGGIVEVITQSGTNEFHGQVFGFYLNDRMSADPRPTLDEPFMGSYAMYDIGFGIGGPIVHDRLWFHAAYNPTFSDEEAEVPGQGIRDYNGTIHKFAAKLDWKIDAGNSLELSVLGDPQKWEGAIPVSFVMPPDSLTNEDPALVKQDARTINALLNGKHWIRDDLLLESKVSAVAQMNDQLPLTGRGDEILFIDVGNNVWSGGTLYDLESDALILNFGLNGTLVRGSHTIKGGLGYRDIKVDYRDKAEVIQRYAPDYYLELQLANDGVVRNRIPSAFLQDSWKIIDRLNLNLGIRWDGQYIYGSDDEIAARFTDQWQPRAGLTYQIDKGGRHQVFGSYGRFYQEISMAAAGMNFMYGSIYKVTEYDHDPRTDPSGGTDVVDHVSTSRGELEGLEGQYFEEFTLGYEQQFTLNSKVTLRGIYRAIGNGLEDAVPPGSGEYVWGNPGYGELADFPRLEREYTALEITYQHSGGEKYNLLASYILSRNRGNYPGIFDLTNRGGGWPNNMPQFDYLETVENSYGLLPNDRTHSFKFSGSYRVGYGLTAGASLLWQRGTPLNVFGPAIEDPTYSVFVIPRGEGGRMNSIWDMNVRLTYDISDWWSSSVKPKILVDMLHIGSPQEPVDYIQQRYLERDPGGGFITENPIYGEPISYQPPFALRMGLTVEF